MNDIAASTVIVLFDVIALNHPGFTLTDPLKVSAGIAYQDNKEVWISHFDFSPVTDSLVRNFNYLPGKIIIGLCHF